MLVEGRLLVERVEPRIGLIVASCRGDSGEIYKLGFDPTVPADSRRAWRCTCEASSKFGRVCSHLRALMLVTVRPAVPNDTQGGQDE